MFESFFKRDELKYSCFECPYQSRWHFALNDHVQRHHLRTSVKPFDCTAPAKIYSCKICNFATNLLVDLVHHLKAGHGQEVSLNNDPAVRIKQEVIDSQPEVALYKPIEYQCHNCELRAFSRVFIQKHFETCKLSRIVAKSRNSLKGAFGNCGSFVGESGLILKIDNKKFHCCVECSYKTVRKVDLRRHINAKHRPEENNEKYFYCVECLYKTVRRKHLERHVKARHVVKEIKQQLFFYCTECEYKTLRKIDLKRHVKAKHDPNKNNEKHFRCVLCPYRTIRRQHLQRHVDAKHTRKETKEEYFRCVECEYKTLRRVDLKRHVNAKHLNNEFKADFFYCAECEYKTLRRSDLKRHVNAKHAVNEIEENFLFLENEVKTEIDEEAFGVDENKKVAEKYFYCNVCEYRTVRKKHLQRHIDAIHSVKESPSWFECALCNFKRFSGNLKKHYKQTHLVNWFDCQFCNYRSKRGNDLKRHILSKHEGTWLQCKRCVFKTKNQLVLNRHEISRHSSRCEGPWFECQHFSRTGERAMDEVPSSDSDICGSDAKSKVELQEENLRRAVDNKERWFKCSLCCYKCKQRIQLMRHHVSKHTPINEVTWFNCELCNYKTKFKNALSRHHNSRHATASEVRWFECKFCNHRTKTSSNLRRHLFAKHYSKVL